MLDLRGDGTTATDGVRDNGLEFLGRAYFREVLARNLNYLLKQLTVLDLE